MGVDYNASAVDRRSPEAQTLGSGPVYVFTDGMVRTGVWIHLDRLDQYGLIAPDDAADRAAARAHVGRAGPRRRELRHLAGLTGTDSTTEPLAAIGTMRA